MKAAINQAGNLVYASEVPFQSTDEIKENWHCPYCQQAVYRKRSHKGVYFFSHKAACDRTRQSQRQPPLETEHHQIAKRIFAKGKDFDAKIEYHFPAIQQTADIYIPSQNLQHNEAVIVEFQNSPILSSILTKRQNAYLSVVKRNYWLFNYADTKNLVPNKRWLQTMLHYHPQLGFYWQMLDLIREEIVINFDLPIIYQRHLFNYREKRIQPIDFLTDFPTQTMDNGVLKQVHRVKARIDYRKQLARRLANKSYRKDISLLYEQGIMIYHLPEWFLKHDLRILFSKTPTWLVFIWGYVLLMTFTNTFSTIEFAKLLNECPRIELSDMPFVKNDSYKILATEMLKIFKAEGFVEQISNDNFLLLV